MAYMVKVGKTSSGKSRYKVRWRNTDGSTSNHNVVGYDEALAYKNRVEGNAIEGIPTRPHLAKRLVKDVASEWRASGVLKGKAASSISRDETICRLHIEPVIGKRRIGTITPEDIQSLVNRWNDSYAPSAVARHFAVVRAICRYAVRKKLILESPCTEDIVLPVVDSVVRPILTGQELTGVAESLGADMAVFLWIGVEGGLRWSEAAGLTSDRINLAQAIVTVDRQLDRQTLTHASVKNKRRRSFAISPQLVGDLRDLIARRGLSAEDADVWLFTDSQGGPLRYSNWRQRIWKPLCAEGGLPGLRYHDLRSLNATTLVALGVDPKTTQVRQGHSVITTTLDIYVRQSLAADRDAADAIGNHFRPLHQVDLKTVPA